MNNNIYHYYYNCKFLFCVKFIHKIIKTFKKFLKIFLKISQVSINSIWFFFLLFFNKPKLKLDKYKASFFAQYKLNNKGLIFHFVEKLNLYVLPTCLIIFPGKTNQGVIFIFLKNFLNSEIGIKFLVFGKDSISSIESIFYFTETPFKSDSIFFLRTLKFIC